MPVSRITKEALKARLDAADESTRPVIVDARLRYPFVHSTLKLPGAVRVEPDQAAAATLPKGRDIVVYDSDPDEITASRVAIALQKSGASVQVLQGGLPEWLAANLPVETKDAVRPEPAAPAPSKA